VRKVPPPPTRSAISFLFSSLSFYTSLHSKGSFPFLEYETPATLERMCGEIHPFDLKSRQVPFSRAADHVETRDSLHSFSNDHVLEEQDPGKFRFVQPTLQKGFDTGFL